MARKLLKIAGRSGWLEPAHHAKRVALRQTPRFARDDSLASHTLPAKCIGLLKAHPAHFCQQVVVAASWGDGRREERGGGAPNAQQRGEVQAVVAIAQVRMPPPAQPHSEDAQNSLQPVRQPAVKLVRK